MRARARARDESFPPAINTHVNLRPNRSNQPRNPHTIPIPTPAVGPQQPGPAPQGAAPGPAQPPVDLSTLSPEEREFWEKKQKADELRAKEVFETKASWGWLVIRVDV